MDGGRSYSFRRVLVVLAVVAILGAFCWLMAPDAPMEAMYNIGTIQSQDRIAIWLGGADTVERILLRSWLFERGVEGSEALWLMSAQQNELDAVIDDLRIPHEPGPSGVN